MSNTTNQIIDRASGLISTIGRSGLNALFPRDFEVYMMGLELTTSDGQLIDYLSFPILPKTYSQSEVIRSNVKKTLNGISIVSSKSFTPKLVTMSGDFGVSFKFLTTQDRPAKGFLFSNDAGVYSSVDTDLKKIKKIDLAFDNRVKTGYGIIKILQAIINKSTGLDSKNKPFKLFFHNPTIGESHLVVPQPNALTINTSVENNGIFSYTLNLLLIAPTSEVVGNTNSNLKNLGSSLIQRGVNTLAKNIGRLF